MTDNIAPAWDVPAPQASAADAPGDRVLAAIARSVRTVLPEIGQDQVRPDRSLSDLGCNSVDRAEVVSLTMEDLGIDVPVNAFSAVTDIGTLADLLRAYA
jgi:polyketide biosynthesis acyl carrier protein